LTERNSSMSSSIFQSVPSASRASCFPRVKNPMESRGMRAGARVTFTFPASKGSGKSPYVTTETWSRMEE